MDAKNRSVALIAVAQVAALALWFSASAALPSIVAERGLSPTAAALLTSAVQAGFVAGTLASALLGLADRLESRALFAGAALAGAAANLALLWTDWTSLQAVLLRFATGAALAGIYPVGMKMIGAWATRGDLGLLIGILVGALSLGSGAPHLFQAFGGVDWRFTIAAASASAALAAILIAFVRPGPLTRRAPPFRPAAMLDILRGPALRLALLGYLGHMWEIYAMWAWLGLFLLDSYALAGAGPLGIEPALAARLTAFAAIGLGGLAGCIAGGALADRIGRTRLTMAAMAASGGCAIAASLLYGAGSWLVALVALLWGLTVNADSAQFSASVTELSDAERIGTMLTMQTCCGFLLTLATIHLVPIARAEWGWPPTIALLAIGPLWGVLAMAALRARPEAVRLAGGRR